jgi:uncharacterized membrane protein
MIARKVLMWLLVAVALWAFLVAGCFLCAFLRPSSLAYVALALLYLWYLYIPALWVIVSIVWLAMQQCARLRRTASSRS